MLYLKSRGKGLCRNTAPSFALATLLCLLLQSNISEAARPKPSCFVQKDADYKIVGIEQPFQTVIFKNEKFGIICFCGPNNGDVIVPSSIDDEMLLANKVALYFHNCTLERFYRMEPHNN